MKPIHQTIAGGPDAPVHKRGDCFRACIASILEVPIESLPNPHGEGWDQAWGTALIERGYWMLDMGYAEWVDPYGYWIASVPSLNLVAEDGQEVLHSVVMRGWHLAHDPSNRNRWSRVRPTDVRAMTFLIEIEPKARVPA